MVSTLLHLTNAFMSAYRLGELLVTLSEHKVQSQTTPRLSLSDTLDEVDFAQDQHHAFTKVYYEEPSNQQDVLNLARSLFDLKEYRKCAHLLAPLTTSDKVTRASALSQRCLFLKNHALFLVSEQAKEEEILETGGSTDKIICSPVINA